MYQSHELYVPSTPLSVAQSCRLTRTTSATVAQKTRTTTPPPKCNTVKCFFVIPRSGAVIPAAYTIHSGTSDWRRTLARYCSGLILIDARPLSIITRDEAIACNDSRVRQRWQYCVYECVRLRERYTRALYTVLYYVCVCVWIEGTEECSGSKVTM